YHAVCNHRHFLISYHIPDVLEHTRICPPSLPLLSFLQPETANTFPSAERATPQPKLSSGISPTISCPICVCELPIVTLSNVKSSFNFIIKFCIKYQI